MQAIGWVVFGTAMILIVLHRDAAKQYLGAFESRYGHRDPGPAWLLRPDPDRAVERLRRRRMLFFVPASVLLIAGIVLIASSR